MLELVVEILLCLVLALAPLYRPLWKSWRNRQQKKTSSKKRPKQARQKQAEVKRFKWWRSGWGRENWWAIVATGILLVGCAVRLIAIEKYPVGLNQDEASVAYEAYAVANYGIDRNGNSWPVHYVAWGSGQNAFYGCLIMPFVKIFGPTTFAMRLPMAILSCITLVVAYFVFRRALGEKKSLVLLAFFVIAPWHIMKSRWGLDCNVFPDLIFWAIAAIYYGVVEQKRKFFILSSIIIGLSAYSYGTSYVFIPVFYLAAYGYLIWQKKLSWKDAILYIAVAGVIAVPMVIFVIINYFKLETVHLGPITIPKLDYNRFATITSMNGNFLSNCYYNLREALKVTLAQDDGIAFNAIPYFGLFYSFSLPFIIVGLFYTIYDRKIFGQLVNAFMLAAIMVAGFVEPNINRVNALWIPMMFYLGYGVLRICNNRRNLYLVCGCYGVSFGWFLMVYFGSYQRMLREENLTFYGLEEAIGFANQEDAENIYISEEINQPYIYYLWYIAYDPNLYLEQRTITEKEVMFQEIPTIGKVSFRIPEKLTKDKVYVMERARLEDLLAQKKVRGKLEDDGTIKLEDFEMAEFGNYSVLY